jgi:tetratricopeptide (TPR) repeat protein/anti-sigma regulatory factor (Ser/Thr protein kinase)
LKRVGKLRDQHCSLGEMTIVLSEGSALSGALKNTFRIKCYLSIVKTKMIKALPYLLTLQLTVLCCISGFGQENKVLEEKANSYKSFKKRSSAGYASSLLREADKLKENNSTEALNKVQEALAMSIAENDNFNEGKCYLLIGEINIDIEEWKLALENFNQAYSKFSSAYSKTPEFKRTLLGLGKTNLELGNYQAALVNLQNAQALNLSYDESEEVQLIISEVYYRTENYNKAANALDDVKQTKVYSNSMPSRVQNQRAKIYARTNESEKTKDIYSNSVDNYRSSSKIISPKEEQSLLETKEEIASALHEQKKYDDEIAVRQQAVEFNTDNRNFSEVTKDKVAISKTLFAKGENYKAIKELEGAAAIADTLSQAKEKANAYLALAEAYDNNGQKNEALITYKKYSQAIAQLEEENKVKLSERSAIIKKQRDIEELSKFVSIGQYEETIEQQTLHRQELVIYGLLLIILIVVVTSFFIYKNAKASKVANQLLALKSLRAQMNPHFIFNALNSVNHFIAQQDERTANKFLSEFSQLMRLVLENSQEDFIPLYKEQEILSLYLKLEHYRFRDKFNYEINIDANINTEAIEVPPMLIQPYIENAVWHGLRYKESIGKLLLSIHRQNGNLVVDISDDGIGRKRSAELKTANQKKHNSTGLKNINERLRIINKVYKSDYKVEVDDLENGAGTHVRIYLPLKNHTK